MKDGGHKAYLGALRIALIFGVFALMTPAWAVDARASFEQLADQLLASGDFDFKRSNAHKISGLASEINWSEADAALIDKIEALMLDDVEGVRMWAAMAAGKMGQPAVRTLPALYRALDLGNAGMFPPGKGGFHSGPSAVGMISQIIWRLEGSDKLSPEEQRLKCSQNDRPRRPVQCHLLLTGK
jgi:hypothetical protein